MGDSDLVFAGYFREVFEYFLNLAWEYVDTLDLHHIVGSSHYDIQTWIFASTCTFARKNAGKVMCTVSDQRSTFFHKGGDDYFTKFTVR